MSVASPPSADLASQVWTALSTYVQQQEDLRRQALADALGMGRGRGRIQVLRAISNGALTLGEVAAAIKVDAPYATVIVDNLETAGLVRRMPHPDDRRRKLVSLTEAGVAAVVRAESFLSQPPAALAGLDPAQLAILADLVNHLVAG